MSGPITASEVKDAVDERKYFLRQNEMESVWQAIHDYMDKIKHEHDPAKIDYHIRFTYLAKPTIRELLEHGFHVFYSQFGYYSVSFNQPVLEPTDLDNHYLLKDDDVS